jgi:hypothetical protein
MVIDHVAIHGRRGSDQEGGRVPNDASLFFRENWQLDDIRQKHAVHVLQQ